ncbi:cellulose binding domain-containing protein [Streptomyces sp. NPDC093094]|uniref:cellulose binding domain-containing protein n=1 Tax=Streptomyces sp. NPDC093094 TaxID=3366026 RepID=UPI003807BC54
MPDLPTARNATEAALFTEYWDTVLSYADLCTSGSESAQGLAREALDQGLREVRAEAHRTGAHTGRRVPRLPDIPQLLTAVRTTAAAWETQGHGHRLAPELRLWLNSEQAARYTGPPLRRPLALRALRDMQEADAALLWLAEVESLPSAVVARRLRLDPAGLAGELAEVRGLFRDRCLRGHLDRPLDAACRPYARLLDAVTRAPAVETPADLSRHLARCVPCSEAAACLRLHGGGLPDALAGGVIGWGGLAYLERRRRAAEVRLGPGRPDLPDDPERDRAHRARVLRGGLIVAAVLVSLLALAVTLMPADGTDDGAAPGRFDDRQPVAAGRTSVPAPGGTPSDEPKSAPPRTPSAAHPRATPSRAAHTPSAAPTAGHTPSRTPAPGGPAPEPHGTATTAERPAPRDCTVAYHLAGQWPDGFQATVTVTTERALDGWRLAWTFRDGQRVTQMWDGRHGQSGSRVTADAADYNRSVPAGGSVTVGFLASWQGANTPAYDFTLDGRTCTVV